MLGEFGESFPYIVSQDITIATSVVWTNNDFEFRFRATLNLTYI